MRDNIDELGGKNGINEMDLIFLKSLMDTPVMKNLVKVGACEGVDFFGCSVTLTVVLKCLLKRMPPFKLKHVNGGGR